MLVLGGADEETPGDTSGRGMRLTFVLPRWHGAPVGGPRVHYEYANRLAARGHEVTVVAPVWSRRTRFGIRRRGVERTLRRFTWFDFDPRVRLAISDGRSAPPADVTVVSHWTTAEMVASFRRRPPCVVQIAYDYEHWMTVDAATRAAMARAFAVPDVVVATSQVVAGMLREAGREPAALIPCAIDHAGFRTLCDPAARGPVVGFLARPGPIKRGEDAVEAMARLRTTHSVRVKAVGGTDVELPAWVERVPAPTDAEMCAFYNDLAVYVLPSAYEGWGLTAVEAMACGAAVVSTRNGGVEDFATDRDNALLVPPCDPGALAAATARLLDDERTRLGLVERGATTARATSWDTSVDALEAVLLCTA